MSKYSGATIEVVNWDLYNPRKTTARPTWFRFENNIATGPGFFGLDAEQKWLWVVILSLVSQKNGKPITWSSNYIQAITGINPKKQDETIDTFIKFVRLRASRSETFKSEKETVHNSYPTDGQTNETDERDETDEHASRVFDLESIYRRYPRKEGKSKGLKKLRDEIKTPEAFEQLIVAVEHYAESRRGEASKFTKHFSTWASEWRDWIDWNPAARSEPDNPAYRRQRGNQFALEEALASIGVTDDEQAG